MPTIPYRLDDGTRCPGTTTIIGRFKDSGGLIHWAWTQGRDGLDYRHTRDHAATAGTLGHELIDAEIHNRHPLIPAETTLTIREQADKALQAYKLWAKQTELRITETEMHIVSEEFRFGGTPDAIGYVAGDFCLLDWKTGKTYPDHLIQLAAYRHLVELEHGEGCVQGVHLLRVGKEWGDFSHHHFPIEMLETPWRMFQLYREAYDLDKTVKGMMK